MTPEDERVFTTAGSCAFFFSITSRMQSWPVGSRAQHLNGQMTALEAKPTQRKLSPEQGDSKCVKKNKIQKTTLAEALQRARRHRTNPTLALHSSPTPTAAFQFVLDWYTCTHHLL